MSKQRSVAIGIATLGLCVLFTITACQSRENKIIRQVDHILIASNDAEELFSLLSDTFQLPVVWPMANYGRVHSGGVSAGNVNLEIVKMPVTGEDAARSRFIGLALEPEPLESSLAELDSRGIRHGAAVPLTTLIADGSIATLWTTVMLPDVSNSAMIVFLCEYTHDVAAQRRDALEQLQALDGGPLTLESVREIVVGTMDLQGSQESWQKLFNPLSPTHKGVWQPDGGPALRLIEAEKDGIQELIIQVRSLSQARLFLLEQGLPGIDSEGGIAVGGLYVQGLTIRLVEKD